ncbi:retrovirus-related pol polyprotein from transposon TNT 1-94 [Tanacetum coccineum]
MITNHGRFVYTGTFEANPMITDPPPTGSTVVPAPRKKLDSEFNEEAILLLANLILTEFLMTHISERYVNVIDSKRHVEKIIFADSIARTSSSSGVKHLIPSRLTRYLNLSSDKALVNKSANWKEWKPIKKVWKPISKPVANSKPQWKPTGRHFSLFEKYPLTRIMEPTDMPIELPPSLEVASDTKLKLHVTSATTIIGRTILKGSTDNQPVLHRMNDMISASQFACLQKPLKRSHGLWHRRLNHLNFGTLNELARNNLVRGLPMLKYDKDHLCPSCQLGKSKKASHPLKAETTNTKFLHTPTYGPLRTNRQESIQRKKVMFWVIVDDYTRYGCDLHFFDQRINSTMIEKFIVKINDPNTTVRLRQNRYMETEILNKTLYGMVCECVGISHETSVPRSPQQNGVVERQNRTLMEAARTMLIFAKAPLFLWAEAVATACYNTLNRSLAQRFMENLLMNC